MEILRLRVFKLYGINPKNTGHLDQSSDAGDIPPASHSYASFDCRESRYDRRSSIDLHRKEDVKNVYDYVIEGSPNQRKSQGEKITDEREESKATERMPGENIHTTESRIETVEAKQTLKMKFVPNAKTGGMKKKFEKLQEPEPGKPAVVKSTYSFDDTTPPIPLGEMKKEENPPEPRKPTTNIFLDNINDRDKSVESGYESESGKSTGRANMREKFKIATEAKMEEKKQKQNFIKNGDKPFSPQNLVEDIKDVQEEQKESVAPLEKLESKHIERKNLKVPSVLDETVGGFALKAEEKKADDDSISPKPGNSDIGFDDRHGLSVEEEDINPFNNSVPPLPLKQSLKESLDNDSQFPSIKLSDRGKGTELVKKGSRDDFRYGAGIDKRKQTRKRQFSKIITNPIYEGGNPEMNELQDYSVGEEERKLRENLIAHEKQKIKDKKKEERAKRKKKKEEKKKKQNSESGTEKDKSEEDEEEDEKEEDEDEEEDEDDEEEEDNIETQSSVTSGSTGSTIRSFYSLRSAIDEKFVPQSIRTLRYSADIVFLLLIGLSIVYLVMQITLFDEINKNLKNIGYSENRLNYLIDINMGLTKLIFISKYYQQKSENSSISTDDLIIQQNEATVAALMETKREGLRTAGSSLKDAQTDLSLKTSHLSDSSLKQINPDDVKLVYLPVTGMPEGYTYTMWQAIMEIVVSAYRVASMPITQVNSSTDSTVYFINKNSLNEVLRNLEESTQAILDETEESREFNVLIFLILMCVASFALVLSTGLLIPVIKKVKMNKQEVLELFILLKKANINDEIAKCKKFLGNFQAAQETEMPLADHEEKEMGQEEEEMKKENLKKDFNKYKGPGRKTKKFKPLNLGLGFVTLKFVIILLIMEGYFIMTYFLSSTFLKQVSSLTKEMEQLISRLPTHSLLLLIVQTAIYSNYTNTIKGINSKTFIETFQDELYEDEDKLLDTFTDNDVYKHKEADVNNEEDPVLNIFAVEKLVDIRFQLFYQGCQGCIEIQ